MSKNLRLFFACFLCRETVLRACKVSAAITPVLTLINHPGLLIGQELSLTLIPKVALTAVVPFCVSGYSSAKTIMVRSREEY